MSTEAAIGHGLTFELHNGGSPGALVAIAEVFDFTPPNETTDVVEATHFGSPDAMREFIAGLTDPGEISFEMNFVPGSASETAILAWKTARAAREACITFPNGWTWTFNAIFTGYEPAAPLDDKMTATVTAKVSGSVLREEGE